MTFMGTLRRGAQKSPTGNAVLPAGLSACQHAPPEGEPIKVGVISDGSANGEPCGYGEPHRHLSILRLGWPAVNFRASGVRRPPVDEQGADAPRSPSYSA